MSQQFFVSAGQSLKGPITNRQQSTGKDGKVVFTCDPPKVYTSHDRNGNPVALPSGYVDYLQNTKDTNGQCKLQNMIESGAIVLVAGASSPVVFAPAMGVDLTINPQGQITQDAK